MKRGVIGLSVAVLVLSVVFLSGCRTPKLGEARDGVPPPELRTERGTGTPGGATTIPDGMVIEWTPPLDEWTDTNVPLAPEAGTGAGEERRWEGVAVYFAYDRATIGASERRKIEALADYMKQHGSYYVVVEGHADDRGSDEYNRALAERRALAVKEYLTTLGVQADRLRTLSYGEERPVVPDATNETQHAKNRRAEFLIGVAK